MDEKTAKQTILEAFDIAMKKGCFGIIENINITEAIKKLNINSK